MYSSTYQHTQECPIFREPLCRPESPLISRNRRLLHHNQESHPSSLSSEAVQGKHNHFKIKHILQVVINFFKNKYR